MLPYDPSSGPGPALLLSAFRRAISVISSDCVPTVPAFRPEAFGRSSANCGAVCECQASDELDLDTRSTGAHSVSGDDFENSPIENIVHKYTCSLHFALCFRKGKDIPSATASGCETCAFAPATPSTALVKGLQRRDAQHDAFTAGRDECKLLRGFIPAPLLLIYSIARPRQLSASKHIFLGINTELDCTPSRDLHS